MFLLLSILAAFIEVQGLDDAKLIYEAIFKDYNPNLRPVNNSKDIITVIVSPILASLEDLNEPQEEVELAYWLHLDWHDQYLTWDPADYGNVTKIMVPCKLVWMPDVTLSTITKLTEIPKSKKVFCQIKHTGAMYVGINQVLSSSCPLSVSAFPFDTQNCTLKYYSWSYGYDQVLLNVPSDKGVSKFLAKNTEWDFVSFDSKAIVQEYATANFSEAFYFLVIKRKPQYYVFTIIVPSFLITSLCLIGLFSPFSAMAERQEKVSMGLTSLLTMSVLLLVISEQMPKTSNGLPMIGIYILFEMFISSLATGCTVLLMYLHKQALKGKPVPETLLKITFINKGKSRRDQSSSAIYFNREPYLLNQVLWKESSSESQTDGEPLGLTFPFLLEQSLKNLIAIRHFVEEKRVDHETMSLWSRVCSRLDLMGLIGFGVVNLIFTLIWFLVGLSL